MELFTKGLTLIEQIREKFRNQQYEYNLHAVDKSILRHVTRKEIEEAIQNGEVIEDYPDDKYGPSCLIYGLTKDDRPIHIQFSYPERIKIKIITVYKPDPDEWINFRERK